MECCLGIRWGKGDFVILVWKVCWLVIGCWFVVFELG